MILMVAIVWRDRVGDVAHDKLAVRLGAEHLHCVDTRPSQQETIKAELIWRSSWSTRRQAETAIFQYFSGFYNPRRRHSALGWKSPLAFERKAA